MSDISPPRVLLVGGLASGENTNAHVRVLGELGFQVATVSTTPYMNRGGRVASWLRHRLMAGPAINELNREILETAVDFRPHILWAEKAVAFQVGTLRRLREQGVVLVSYLYDNPFGDMHEPVWRLFLKTISEFDIHVVQRESSITDFKRAGARRVMRIFTPFDPAAQYPPPDGWSDAERTIDVSFTGSPFDDRAQRLESLWRDHDITVDIRGDRWARALAPDSYATLVSGPSVWGDDYRMRFWKSKICLAFVTRANRDETAHRCFEIAGSQGFMLSERTDMLRACFTEGEEAAYFSDIEECAAMIRRYLPDTVERERIARNARARAVASGYALPDQFARVFREVSEHHPSLPMPDRLPPPKTF